MKILFAIPFFKNTDYLSRTLKSVQAQTDSRFEVIVLDDSIDLKETDSAKALVESIADSKFRYHRNAQNLGMAANWNQGLDLATGFDLVTLLHADDQLMPEFAEKMFSALQSHPEASVYFAEAQIIDEEGKPRFSFPDWYKKFLLPEKQNSMLKLAQMPAIKSLIAGNYIFCPTMAYRPEKIAGLRFDGQYRMVLDFDFILRLLMNDHVLVGLYEKPLYAYRRHTENATAVMTQSMHRFNEEVQLYDRLAQQLTQKGERSLAAQATQKSIVKKNLLFNVAQSMLRFDFKAAKKYFVYWRNLAL